MTLNITVTTAKCIYQCADYQMTDRKTGTPAKGGIQKIFVLNSFDWSATICYSGVAKFHNVVDVEKWLSDLLGKINPESPFDHLINQLLSADDWLQKIPPDKDNRHSFSVGAFIGSKTVFTLISNFETLNGLPPNGVTKKLAVYQTESTSPKAYISGVKSAVKRPERRRLEALARSEPDHELMYSALAQVNREVASSVASVSRSCFTSYLKFTGEGSGRVHEIQHQPNVPAFPMSELANKIMQKMLTDHFGPGGGRHLLTVMMREATSEEEHKARIREKPDDPNLHSNYGAYLHKTKKELDDAEQEYLKAIALDPTHVNALGNLANLVSKQGDDKRAGELYREALESSPGTENVSWNYARFLFSVQNDFEEALKIVDLAIQNNLKSGRLHLLRGDLRIKNHDVSGALDDYYIARKLGADQVEVEARIAVSLQLNCSPKKECIAAYRTALALAPKNGTLMLNLAQLLFISGSNKEARKLLKKSVQSRLDEPSQMEANFYILSHTSDNHEIAFQEVKRLLNSGALLDWDVRPNIESLRKSDSDKAKLLEEVSEIMTGEKNIELLDRIIRRW